MSGGEISPRRSRLVLVAVSAAVLAVVGLVVLAVRALPPGDLDGQAVERDVAAEFEQRERVGLDLECPEDMMVASGEVHVCDGTTSDGEEVTVTVQISDELDGSYEWGHVYGPLRTATPEPRPGG